MSIGEAIALEVLRLANIERGTRGLDPLVSTVPLDEAARYRSDDMVGRDYFDHVDPDGVDPFMRLKQRGIPFTRAAENIAWNTDPARTAAQRVMQSWMGSKGHRENLLDARLRKSGVGVQAKVSGGWVFTQLFTD